MRIETRCLSLRSLALAVLLGFAATPMCAQWCGQPVPPPKSPPPAHPCPAACKSCGGDKGGTGDNGDDPSCKPDCSGSPCFVASGVYFGSTTDLSVRGVGPSLTVQRRYQTSRLIDGPMGYGSTTNLAARLYYSTYMFSAPSTYRTEAVVLLPSGGVFEFQETSPGVFTPPAGRHDTLVRNIDGSFDLTYQYSFSKMHFGSDGSLLTLSDDYGNAVTFTRDPNGRVQQITDTAGSGRSLLVSWGADGRISDAWDATQTIRIHYDYNSAGALQTFTDPGGRLTHYSYVTGRFGPLLSEVSDNWGRVVTDITYDSADRVHTYTDAGETYTYTYAYHDNPLVTAKTDSSGNVYTFGLSNTGYVTNSTLPSGDSTQLVINSDGSIQQRTDAAGTITQYAYDALGRYTSVTRDAHGLAPVRLDYVYDPSLPASTTSITPKNPGTGQVDPNWQAWKYDYYHASDPAPGALHHLYRVESDGMTLDTLATYLYYSNGKLKQRTSATGGVTDYAYDSSWNLQTVTGPANNDFQARPATNYGFDSLGRVTSVTDPLNDTTSRRYDALDRITRVTLPKPSPSSNLDFTTTYSYDNYDSGTGLLFTLITDPNGQVNKFGYDQYGQLVKSIDSLGKATTYGYTKGLRISLTDANSNVTSFAYDNDRRLLQAMFPDTAVETYTYTHDSRLGQKTDRNGHTLSYTYDGFKRLVKKTYPDSFSIVYTYQGQKLTQVVDTNASPPETHTFDYDPSFRPYHETQSTRGAIAFQYNPDDTVASYTVQGGGPTATYTYYPDGSLDTIAWSLAPGIFKYTYDLNGRYQAIAFPNHQTRSFTYDNQGRLTQLANSAPPPIMNIATYAYGYDKNYTTGQYTMLGQRVSTAATVPSQGLNGQLFTYEFDPDYQLNKVTYPNVPPFNGEVDSWTYDWLGNRLTSTVNQNRQTYTYFQVGSNNWQRLSSDGVNSYTYDANGNTLTRTGYTFGHDDDNRLTSISGNTAAAYSYDYRGRRSGKAVGSTSTYLYDRLSLIQEQGTAPADYLLGPGMDAPLAMSRGGQIYYYSTDALRSVSIVSNSRGQAQNAYLYDAWGQVRAQTGSLANPFTYTARETAEAGLNFYRARYYQPSIGRFIQEDPKEFRSGDANFYAYVSGSPLKFTDPTGHQRAWGNWCGPDWTGGLPEPYLPEHAPSYKPPLWWDGGVDVACQTHDRCYYTCRESYPCDPDSRGGCMHVCDNQLSYNLAGVPIFGALANGIGDLVQVGHCFGGCIDPGPNGGARGNQCCDPDPGFVPPPLSGWDY